MSRLKLIILGLTAVIANNSRSMAQATSSEDEIKAQANTFFSTYRPHGNTITPNGTRVESYAIDDLARTLTINVSSSFACQEFTSSNVGSIYKKLKRRMPRPFNKYKLCVRTCGLPIEQYITTDGRARQTCRGQWGSIDYTGKPWTENISRPTNITHGLYNRHISLWASHGRYFDTSRNRWQWQRPNLFCTTEDLFTQTIVVPYLIPMLQNAGATVFTPRERDWQRNEVIVDNDDPTGSEYSEDGEKWLRAPYKGFAKRKSSYNDGENPFGDGTARMTVTTKKNSGTATATYRPRIPEEGEYAVYASYQTISNSTDDAEYIVYHKGQQTTFRVNQQMGGGTWVYLGTFDFDKGCNDFNKVVVTNRSAERNRIVTTDAIRFGGGMGNITRSGSTSGLPRCLEGARYYAQWAGAPYNVYSSKNGADDYADDINARSLMTNWLAGGSSYMPAIEGQGVPIELSLAIHSDAGYEGFGNGLIGSLAICTTRFNDGRLNSGVSRMLSHDLADSLLTTVTRDIKAQYGRWSRRYLWDRNYSETRCPEVPSAILEMLSHQNFPDMLMGQDPNFKFTMARAIYKSILKYVCKQHGVPCIVQPLAPKGLSLKLLHDGRLRLAWMPVYDKAEPTACPTSYNIYTSTGSAGFDNGTATPLTHYDIKPEPGVKYCFQVSATNRGGESFRSETLTAAVSPKAKGTILIINGFNRLSAPAVIDDGTSQGFDLDSDIGVQRGLYAGWSGRQECFSKSRIGTEGPGGLGYGGNEMAGTFVRGNDFNYPSAHADALANCGYNIVSCSSSAVESGIVNLADYDCVDLILGLEKYDKHALAFYKSFTASMQKKLTEYTKHGGRLIVSGANIGSDMASDAEKAWLQATLKIQAATRDSLNNGTVSGLGMQFSVCNKPNPYHYAAQKSDAISPARPAFCAMQYADGSPAAVAYDGNDYKCFAAGFPLECITNKDKLASVLSGILNFVMKK